MMPERRVLGLGGLVLLLAASPLAGQQPVRDTLGLRPAFRLIDQYVTGAMQRANTPGLALALVDRRGLLTVRTYGYADLAHHARVVPETRFEIGSISKSFTAIALMQLQDEGKFDPARPVVRYLPWFTPHSRFRPITGRDLLTHTAGLPRDRDDIPSSPAEAWFVRERTVGSAPGTRWSYSNIGYQVLGVLVEKLDGRPYPDAIRARILEPLGIGALPAFTNATRPLMAIGYDRLYDDRPARATDPLVPAPWVEYASGDGSIVASAPELGAYLTMLLNRGRTLGGRVLSDSGFARLTARHVREIGPGSKTGYGYGLFLGDFDGHPSFWHSGGMLGYSSYLLGEPELGIGAVVLVNGPGNPGRVARFTLGVLDAAMRGDSLPAPEATSPTHVDHPERYAGRYQSADGRALTFVAAEDTLLLLQGGARLALTRYGEDAFLGPADSFPLFPLRFAGDSLGMTEVWYGGNWYTAPRYRGPRSFRVPPAWQAYPGHYRIMQPWEPDFRVVLRKGRLWLIGPEGGEQPLEPLGTDEFRVGEAGSAERIRFDQVLDGHTLRATLSGMAYYRFFTP